MRLWDSLRALLFAVFRRSKVDAEMDEELRAHIERRAEDLERGGMTREESHRRARVEFGGIESVKEKVRDLFWETYFDTLLRDARYAARSLCRDRGFALTAIFALALGVGSTCMVFSVIYNGLLRPFPYKDANRLATFYVHDLQDANLQEPGRGDRGGFTSAEFLELRQRNGAFEDMIGFITEDLSCTRGGATTQLHAALVTPNTFQFLGVDPLIGRSIGPADAEPAAPPVFAMNYRVWQKHFSGDPKVVGTSFVIAGQPRTLVAVMPPRFQIDPEGSDIWIPSKPNPGDSTIPMNAAGPMHLWWPLGRLRSGMSQRTATSDLNVVGQGLAKAFPSLYPPRFTMVMRPFADVVVGNFKSMLYALAVAVAMLLLITCANVANPASARNDAAEGNGDSGFDWGKPRSPRAAVADRKLFIGSYWRRVGVSGRHLGIEGHCRFHSCRGAPGRGCDQAEFNCLVVRVRRDHVHRLAVRSSLGGSRSWWRVEVSFGRRRQRPRRGSRWKASRVPGHNGSRAIDCAVGWCRPDDAHTVCPHPCKPGFQRVQSARHGIVRAEWQISNWRG